MVICMNDQGYDSTCKTWIFVIFFSRPGKCLEFAQKVVKTWNFNSIHEKNLKFANSMFRASLFKMSFTKNNSDLFLCHIYIINTNTKPNWPWISLLLPGKYIDFCVTREVGTLYITNGSAIDCYVLQLMFQLYECLLKHS